MNQIILMGRLTKDPEMRLTSAGKPVVNFTLAVNRPFAKETTDFINCVAWNKTAELIEQHVKKGHRLLVNGYLTIDSYEDQNGAKKSSTRVQVQNFEFIEPKSKNSDDDEFPEDWG